MEVVSLRRLREDKGRPVTRAGNCPENACLCVRRNTLGKKIKTLVGTNYPKKKLHLVLYIYIHIYIYVCPRGRFCEAFGVISPTSLLGDLVHTQC